MLDLLDRQLLHALQLDARAPFSRIAEVLEVSDRTVARRYGRLRSTGAVRIAVAFASHRTGNSEWLVRLRIHPDATAGITHALAARADSSWVTVLSGGTELVVLLRTPDGGLAPLEQLARHRQILQVDAQRLLRHLMDHPWRGRTSALTPDQIAALTPQGALTSAASPTRLTDLDRRLFSALATDARAAYPTLARKVGWSESAVRRRLEELRSSLVVRFEVEVDPLRLGFTEQCLLWLNVVPTSLVEVSRTLTDDPEMAFVGATTGAYNLFAIVVCRDADELFAYVSYRIGALEGIDRMESAPVVRYAKRSASPIR